MVKLIGGEGLIVGRRLLPAFVRRYSNGLSCKILDAAPRDGRFAIFICFGDLTISSKVEQLKALRDLVYCPGSLWSGLEAKTTNPSGAAAVLRILGVTTTSHLSVEAATVLHGSLGLGLPTSLAVFPELKEPILFNTFSLYCDDSC